MSLCASKSLSLVGTLQFYVEIQGQYFCNFFSCYFTCFLRRATQNSNHLVSTIILWVLWYIKWLVEVQIWWHYLLKITHRITTRRPVYHKTHKKNSREILLKRYHGRFMYRVTVECASNMRCSSVIFFFILSPYSHTISSTNRNKLHQHPQRLIPSLFNPFCFLVIRPILLYFAAIVLFSSSIVTMNFLAICSQLCPLIE